jgi:phage/plasmid-like protein (TIGR03299 family)
MSHEIETIAWVGEVPWHGLGKKVLADLTPVQMMKEAGVDWTVSKVPAYIKINGEEVALDTQALVRSTDNAILTEVSEDWNPVQNLEAFEFFNEFIAAGDMEMHTAGSLKDGQIVWALAKVKESFTIFGKDKVDSYLLFSNPHQYGKGLNVRFTPVRVVCNNTLTLSLSQKSENQISLNHRTKFDPELVKKTLGMAHYKLDTYKEMALVLGAKKYTNENIVEYFQRVFPVNGKDAKKEQSKNAKRALEVIEQQPGFEYAPGTFWSAFNCATYLVDHELGRTADNRMTSAWYGQGARTKTNALELALEYAA